MERRGGLCIARYGGDADAACRVGRIMLRFRPIAPKPAAGGGAAAGTASDACPPRTKRRGGGREGRRGRKARRVAAEERREEPGSISATSSSSNSSSSSAASSVVTLPLMPETPERKETAATLPFVPTVWRPPEAAAREAGWCGAEVVVVAPRPLRPAGSWVTLECVTDTWREGEVGGASDEEVRRGMEGGEAWPGFVSDEWGRVTWVNGPYRKMVRGQRDEDGGEGKGDDAEEQVSVALLTKGAVPAACRAFTCRVRVRYASRTGRGSLAAPCDVWRLDGGGLAWRLDVRAALSLAVR